MKENKIQWSLKGWVHKIIWNLPANFVKGYNKSWLKFCSFCIDESEQTLLKLENFRLVIQKQKQKVKKVYNTVTYHLYIPISILVPVSISLTFLTLPKQLFGSLPLDIVFPALFDYIDSLSDKLACLSMADPPAGLNLCRLG